MKVRVGVGVGAGLPAAGQGAFGETVDALESLGFDSLWLPEILTVPSFDPVAGLAFTAARTTRLKLGTTMVLPGRNVVRLAKELATLDAVSDGRLLVTLVPGIGRGLEAGAVGVPATDRGPMMDELLPVLRRLWAGERVTHVDSRTSLDGVGLAPLPVQDPLEVWTGGMAPAALRRCGRLADGWLPAACTPAEAEAGRTMVDETAARSGRRISPEHFGVSLGYATRPPDDRVLRALAASRPGVDPASVLPVGLDALRASLEGFIAVGFSKFVVRPVVPPHSWGDELTALKDAVLDLQS